MVSFDVRISPKALQQLECYVDYIQHTLLNDQAAQLVWEDAIATRDRLSQSAGSLALCRNQQLQRLGYHLIRFSKHRYVMLYRVVDQTAFVDAIFHELQDYEHIFADELTNG